MITWWYAALYHSFSDGIRNVGAKSVFGLMVLTALAGPEVAVPREYAPLSVVVVVWAPLGWPLLIQLANLAQSNQLTYDIGRFPVLFKTEYV